MLIQKVFDEIEPVGGGNAAAATATASDGVGGAVLVNHASWMEGAVFESNPQANTLTSQNLGMVHDKLAGYDGGSGSTGDRVAGGGNTGDGRGVYGPVPQRAGSNETDWGDSEYPPLSPESFHTPDRPTRRRGGIDGLGLQQASASTPVSARPPVRDDAKIAQIVAMGFTEEQSVEALNRCDQDVMRAITYILG